MIRNNLGHSIRYVIKSKISLVTHSPNFIFRYREQVEGISPPNPELHELYIDLEPHLGALVGAQVA